MTLPEALIERLRDVRSVGVITGAGVSVESGIPAYRGQGGIYDDPEQGDRTVEALSAPTLARDPDRTWRVIAELARRSVSAEPNAAHRAIAELERAIERFTLLTQNIDGLHERAGSRSVIEIHGNVFHAICIRCTAPHHFSDANEIAQLSTTPICRRCSGALRPDVVLFGEMLDVAKLARIRTSFYETVPDLVIISGTSAMFPYIYEPVMYARAMGRLTIEINLDETPVSAQVDYAIHRRAGEVFPELVACCVT